MDALEKSVCAPRHSRAPPHSTIAIDDTCNGSAENMAAVSSVILRTNHPLVAYLQVTEKYFAPFKNIFLSSRVRALASDTDGVQHAV